MNVIMAMFQLVGGITTWLKSIGSIRSTAEFQKVEQLQQCRNDLFIKDQMHKKHQLEVQEDCNYRETGKYNKLFSTPTAEAPCLA